MGVWTVPGYTETRELGTGGGGRVVLAIHDATGVPVAVKYLGERLRADAAFVREFRAEARLLGGLDTPHVVRLYEYVEAPAGAAIVMELVDGVALRALLAREGATGPEAALVVLKGSLLGLAAAHARGVVHRDYKPENVLVAADGSSKLVDFGIAARHGATPGVAGTPAYMAPEQWEGGAASPAADVYAATATFYECLTGRKPFGGENFAELALQHIGAPVPEDDTPEPVRPLIRRGLAKTPADRPADAAAFVAELEEIAGAAYGPDWEERGRGRLAALAALLPLLFPSAAAGAAGTTDAATTALAAPPPPVGGPGAGRRLLPGLRGVVAAIVAVVIAGLAAVAARAGEDRRETTAEAVATTSAGPPGPGTPSPPSDTPASSAAPASPAASPSVTPSGSSGPPSPTADPTASASTPAAPEPVPTVSASATASVTPVPARVRVTSVAVTLFRQTGPVTGQASVDVTTDGPGPVTVVITWYTGDSKGEPGVPEGSETFSRSGATSYTLPLAHTFQGKGCWWAVQASTDPAWAGGGSTQQLLTRRGCPVS
ncbi:protein kinase domain-containing protein [Streptomyces genisteinicus]|uniref:non-specific serine/threonine protein kinase n=1 Tax=Streptomyces genisteinicus TaxID=2768068 RepID=A0A7H0I2G0_9ACTN|nr:serine/threonine-protein kinase [Streptomyces genisteinicus]QNP66976.1 serine/threonine protein kinase [Streptomyces genisteinicus]